MTVIITNSADADVADFQDFDPNNWLGYAVNLLTTGGAVGTASSLTKPADLRTHLLSRDVRTVLMSSTTVNKHVSPPSNSNFKVPDNVNLFEDERLGTGELKTFHSGSDVLHSLSSDTEFSASYFGVTASAACTTTLLTIIRPTFITKFLNHAVVQAAKTLPAWENAASEDRAKTVTAYRNFFNKFGTHVVKAANYGFRYQLEVQQQTNSSDSSSAFEANVSVKYMESSVSEDFKTKNNYSNFDINAKASVSAIGGNGVLATELQSNPADATLKHAWHDDIGKRPHEGGIMSLELMTIGEALRESTDDSVSAFARPLDFALFDLQRACVRRLILTVDITVLNCTLTLDPGAVFDDPPDSTSPIGFFHRPDSQAENFLQYTQRNRTNWPLFFNVPMRVAFTCTIRADRSGKIPITITRDQNTVVPMQNIPISVFKPGPLEFVVERYRNDTDRLTLQTFQLPGNHDFPVHTDEQKFTLDLAPNKDFWWPQ